MIFKKGGDSNFFEGSDAHDTSIWILAILPISDKEKRMTVAEAIGMMFAFGMFILALLTYLDRNQKK